MPKAHFTDGFIRDLRFEKEIAKVLKRRDAKRDPSTKAPPAPQQVDFFEKVRRGITLILTLTSTGNLIWSVQFYSSGRPRRQKIGYFDHSDSRYPKLSSKQAEEVASRFDVQEATKPKAGSFKDVAEEWLKREVEGKLRSEREIRRQLKKYVYPRWQTKPFAEVRRLEVSELLDHVEDKSGVRMADAVLATVRSIMKWREARDENYTSPIVAKMRRDKRKPDERKRKRILADEEIKAVWEAGTGQFGDIVKLALLTAQRREKIATIKWDDIDFETRIWTIATEPGEKGNPGRLKLPKQALAIIEAQPKLAENPYVFGSARGRQRDCFNAWSQRKAELDERLPKMESWVIHDLRRTTRSLMSKLGVITEVAEKVLGHKEQSIVGVYDRHDYEDEKADALERVAAYIDGLINPRDNVVSMPSKPRRKKKAA